MAGTLKHIALSLVLIPLLAAAGSATELTEIDLMSTSGTLQMRKMQAERAQLGPDSHLVAEKPRLTIRLSAEKRVQAEAESGLVVVGGDRGRAARLIAQVQNASDIRRYGRDFRQIQHPGDILLSSPEKRTVATLGETGTIRTGQLVWSEYLGKYFLPGSFEQETQLESGAVLQIQGGCALISKDFDSWSYFGSSGQDPVLFFKRPESEE